MATFIMTSNPALSGGGTLIKEAQLSSGKSWDKGSRGRQTDLINVTLFLLLLELFKLSASSMRRLCKN